MNFKAAHYILFLLLLVPCMLHAQGNTDKAVRFRETYSGALSGKVTDRLTGRSIAGATVYINDLKLGSVTDTSGYYAFRNLPSGSYLVEARSIGYKAITKTVVINGAVTENFALQENVVEESEVVITGISRATQIKRNPIPIVSLNKRALTTNINTNIIDALTRVPGVTAVTTGPNVSKPFIRGLGFNRILTLYDGVRQEGQQWGEEHGVEVDQYSIDRVEIVKGPASLSYGSDALAGVVNLIPTQPAPEGKIIGDILAEYMTNNRYLGGSAMLSGTKNGFEWLGRISHKQATNYTNKIDGRVYGTSFNETDATGYLGIHGKWGYSHLSFSLYDDQQEIPDGSRDAYGRFTKQIDEADTVRQVVSNDELNSYSMAVLHQHVRHFRVYSNNSFSIGNGRLAVNLAFQNSLRQEFSHPTQPQVPGLHLDLTTYDYDVKHFLPEWHGWNITVGLNGMYQLNDVTKGSEFVIPGYHQFDVGPFFMFKKAFDKLDVAGGIRYDTRFFTNQELYLGTDPATGFDEPVYGSDTTGANKAFSYFSHTFSGVSSSLGLTYNVSEKVSLKANVARGFRAPNIAEISSNGIHPGTNIYQLGNMNFRPEFSLQEDLGFTYASNYLVINLSVFNNDVQNFIFNQRLLTASGADSVVVPGNETFKFQQNGAKLYGGEMNIDLHPFKPLHFENSFSMVIGENRGGSNMKINDSSKYLPYIPPFHGLSELRYDFNLRQHRLVNGFVKAQLVYYAAQNKVYLANNTETPTPGYTLFNFGVGTGIANKAGKIIVNVSAMTNNLFDVAYFSHLSRLKYFLYSPTDTDPAHGIHEMGRNIALRLDFPLSF